jgi:hypothetical protein
MQSAMGQPSRENQTGKSPTNPGRFTGIESGCVLNAYWYAELTVSADHGIADVMPTRSALTFQSLAVISAS